MKALLCALILLSPISSRAESFNASQIIGAEWLCSLDGKVLGSLTFHPANAVALSWQAPSTWVATEEGIEIFGTPLKYTEGKFTGVNSSGKEILLIHAPGGAEELLNDIREANLDTTPIEEISQIKFRASAFSVRGQKVAFGRSKEVNWRTSWGSYDAEYLRHATYLFEVGHFGSEGHGLFEILFLGKEIETGEQYAYSFKSIKLSVNGDTELKTDVFMTETNTLYNALKIRLRGGSKPDSWVAWVRDGEDVMSLSAGRGSIVDYYEKNPLKLLRQAQELARKSD